MLTRRARWSSRDRLVRRVARARRSAERRFPPDPGRDAEAQRAITRYRGALPTVAVSRCPYTLETVRMPIDLVGLDGPWWDRDAPARQPVTAPPTFLGLSGSMRLAHVERLPNLVDPGPESPFVLPQILAQPGVVAVLSSLTVGSHQAVVAAYFAEPGARSVVGPPEWGATWATALDDDGERTLVDLTLHDLDRDGNLAPWLDADRVGWIAPGNELLSLDGRSDKCPYLPQAGTVPDVACRLLVGGELRRFAASPTTLRG